MTGNRASRARVARAFGLLALAGCAGDDGEGWIYWLSDPQPDAIAGASGAAVVTDPSRDGSASGAFSAAEVASMGGQNAAEGEGGRPVLAYLSIGEAEDYRGYWEDSWDADGDGDPDPGAPSWLGPANPDWPGNYKVRYWEAGWQDLLLGEGGPLDQAVDAGFDGVYLDIIDAYYYWSEETGERPLETAAGDMLDLLDAIAVQGRAARAGFAVYPQNGEYVGYDAGNGGHQRLLDTIDGFGVEDAFYPGNRDEDNGYDPDEDRLDILAAAADGGEIILSVEYLTDSGEARSYRKEALDRGFLPCVARRDLDALPQ